MNECLWCGSETEHRYCSESCKEADCLPVCKGCGDKIELNEKWRWDDYGDKACHINCLELESFF